MIMSILNPILRFGLPLFLICSSNAYPQSRTVGLLKSEAGTGEGYTLFAPKHNTMTYLINNNGEVVHKWTKSIYEPGQSVYLLPNGNLLRMCFARNQVFGGGGDGGRFEEYDWNDNLVWEMDMNVGDKNSPDNAYMCHHDCAILPNGNILAIVWEYKNYNACIQAGRNPSRLDTDKVLWPDYIAEIQKTGSKGGNIVWQWHTWDHLVQDYDATKSNYGVVGDHPELVDVNFWAETGSPYRANWNHVNTITYNAEYDIIMISVRGFSEIWMIDHSTTTTQAAGHSGGNFGKGGDILYRWGNPRAYRAGTTTDQILFQGHDCKWIESGLPGAGNILMFNNGPERLFSTVVEWDFPEPVNHSFSLNSKGRYDPEVVSWEYNPVKTYQDWKFYSGEISGAQRLSNGNTLICSGTKGFFSEINQNFTVLWEYINPMEKERALAWNESPHLDDRGHGMNAVFKIHRYPFDYPAFTGKDLTPSGVIETGTSSTGISPEVDPEVTCYPNPFSEELFVRSGAWQNKQVNYEILNTAGQRVVSGTSPASASGILSINTSAIRNQGIYFLILEQDGNRVYEKINRY
jgi:hypothetical protein